MSSRVNPRPPSSPKENFGMLLIVILAIAESILCIAILSEGIDAQFIYSLDITGLWAVDAIYWSNASVEYRDLMIPVYISMQVYLLTIMLVTIVTRDWNNISEWAGNMSFSGVVIFFVLCLLVYMFFAYGLGTDEIIYDINELFLKIERITFTNKYSFLAHSIFFAIVGYHGANSTLLVIAKIKNKFK